MGLASLFAVPAPAIRSNRLLRVAQEAARGLSESLDQGLDSVDFGKPRLDILQPRVVRLAGLVSQSQLGVFELSK
jgi:hypothetical protein